MVIALHTRYIVGFYASIVLPHSADEFYDISYSRDFRVDIRSDGRVLWSFGGNFNTACTLDMTYYPFDMQQCDIDVENWAYTNESVHLYHLINEVHLAVRCWWLQ